MTRSHKQIWALLFALSVGIHAQARPDCQVVPKTLAAMHGCYRPLLVFSPGPKDPRLRHQASLLDSGADDMMDRFVLFTPIVSDARRVNPPADSPYTLLGPREVEQARARFRIPQEEFAVLLLGEDGSVKLRSSAPVSVERLNALIDRMPTRRDEMRRPHAN